MDLDQISEDYKYAEMQLICTKVIKIPPKRENNTEEIVTGECAYVDGLYSDLYNTCHLRINKMTAGRYIIFYTAKFSSK